VIFPSIPAIPTDGLFMPRPRLPHMGLNQLIREVALTIGLAWMGIAVIAAALVAVSMMLAWRAAPGEDADRGSLADIVADSDIRTDGVESASMKPRRNVSVDWSVKPRLDDDEVRDVKHVLERAGYHVHPYVTGPTKSATRDWGWNDGAMGMWVGGEPELVVEYEDGEERVYEPDLSCWSPGRDRRYGPRDEWERENL
jgi:hypothetical protein